MGNYSKRSKRERLLATARRLGLNVSPSISDNALENTINRQPATAEQLHIISEFLRPLKKQPPRNMTFGAAKQAIAAIHEDLNHYAIQAMQLQEGQVREWRGKYYFIVKIYGNSQNHTLLVQVVKLARPKAGRATLTPVGDQHKLHPAELLYVSMPVDLDTWQPNSKPGFKNKLDEPPF